MDWVNQVPSWIAAGIFGIIAWFYIKSQRDLERNQKRDREELQKQIDARKREIQQHVRDCDEIPKSTIIEKLDGLCEKQDLHHEENCRRFSSLENDVRDQRHALSRVLLRAQKQ